MYYEINVAKNGKHLFAIHQRSCQLFSQMQVVLREIIMRFPQSEGFGVDVVEHQDAGTHIPLNELLVGDEIGDYR